MKDKLPIGFYIAGTIFGTMVMLDSLGIAKAPIFAYVFCGVAAIFFMIEDNNKWKF